MHLVQAALAAFVATITLSCVLETGAAAQTPGIARVVGDPSVVQSFGKLGCQAGVFPDAPARAFRDSNGQIHLVASHAINYHWVGTTFSNMKTSCQLMFKGARHDNPEDFDDYGWLASFYTQDGQTVHALIHNEFHGSDRPKLCPSQNLSACWENTITYAASKDGGKTFSRPAGQNWLVASLPYRYKPGTSAPFGYFNPTNIVKWNSFFYVILPMIDKDRKISGLCLARNSNLSDPSAWRGWDGKGFSVPLDNIRRAANADEAPKSCTPLDMNNLYFGMGSISYHPKRQKFYAVMRFNRWDKKRRDEKPGVYISSSSDLIHWETPTLLLSDEEASTGTGGERQVEYYPALLDEKSSSLSFDTISDRPMLFTIPISKNVALSERSLVARQIELR